MIQWIAWTVGVAFPQQTLKFHREVHILMIFKSCDCAQNTLLSLFLVKNYNNKGARLHQVEVVALCSWGQVIILRKWWLVTTVMKKQKGKESQQRFCLEPPVPACKGWTRWRMQICFSIQRRFPKSLFRGQPLMFIQRRNFKNVYSHETPQYY